MINKSLFCILTLCLIVSCGGGGGGGSSSQNDTGSNSDDEQVDSGDDNGNQQGATGSHNAGQNCVECHQTGGAGEAAGIFSVAGTIFQSGSTGQPNATVRLYVENTNTQIISLTTDASGNFYTTQEVTQLTTGVGTKPQFVDGAEVVVEGPGGSMRTMPGIISGGGCNGCHHNGSGGNGRIVVN